MLNPRLLCSEPIEVDSFGVEMTLCCFLLSVSSLAQAKMFGSSSQLYAGAPDTWLYYLCKLWKPRPSFNLSALFEVPTGDKLKAGPYGT